MDYILRSQYINTFGPITDDRDDGREFKGLYKRFVAKYCIHDNPFTVSVGEWAGTENVELEINWQFSYDDIPILIKEFDQLFDKKDKL